MVPIPWIAFLAAISGAIMWLSQRAVFAADYTPLITSTSFDGIRTDVTTAAAGIVSICLIVIGLGVLIRVFTR